MTLGFGAIIGILADVSLTAGHMHVGKWCATSMWWYAWTSNRLYATFRLLPNQDSTERVAEDFSGWNEIPYL